MSANGFVSSLDAMATWVTRMALLNFLWLLYSLRGLFVAGIFPATVAALGIARKWLMDEQEVNIRKTFKEIYRRDFGSANGLGWILTIIGGVLYMNYQAINALQGEVLFIVPFAFYLVVFFYFLIVIWSFPLTAHYNASIFQQMKNAFVIGLTKIHISIATMVSLFAIVYFSLELPTLILFFLFSIGTLIWMAYAIRVFNKFDNKKIIETEVS